MRTATIFKTRAETESAADIRRRLIEAEGREADGNAAARAEHERELLSRYNQNLSDQADASAAARILEDAYAAAALALASAAAALIAEQRRYDKATEAIMRYETGRIDATPHPRRPASPAVLPVGVFRDLKPAQSAESILSEWRQKHRSDVA